MRMEAETERKVIERIEAERREAEREDGGKCMWGAGEGTEEAGRVVDGEEDKEMGVSRVPG